VNDGEAAEASHGDENEPFLAVVETVVDELKRERVAKCFLRVLKRDAVLGGIRLRFGSVPFEL
jgi:hypothetical protein